MAYVPVPKDLNAVKTRLKERASIAINFFIIVPPILTRRRRSAASRRFHPYTRSDSCPEYLRSNM